VDKRDFYRELMDEYAFDKEKIYNNAKNGRLSGKSRIRGIGMPVYIGMTAAVAAVVVTVGTVTALNHGGQSPQPLTSGDPLGALSSEQRIQNGKDAVRKNENSKDLVDVLVTFSKPLSPAEAQGVLLARAEGSVPVKTLFLDDETKVDSRDGVEAVFVGSGERKITGAVIRCAGYLMAELQDNDLVLAVELYTQGDAFNPVLPIVPDNTSSESVSGSTSDNSVPEHSDSSDISSEPTESSEPNSSSSETISSTSEPNGTSGSVDIPLYQLTNHINEADGGAENVYVGSVFTHQINLPVNVIASLPEGISLPGDREKFSCGTDDIGAMRAYFLNDNVFYVRTKSDMRLYTITDGKAVLTASMPCADAKVFWIGENGGSLLALGSSNIMYEVNADSGIIREISLAEAVGSGEIKEIAYNAESRILALNVYENGEYSLKIYEGGFEPDKLKTLYTAPNNFALIGADSGVVYFGAYVGEDLKIYTASVNQEAYIICSVQGEYNVRVNTAFTHAVLVGDKLTLIYDPSSLNVVVIGNESAINFGVSAHSFYCDGEYYTVSGGEKLPSGGVSVISKIDFKNSFSKYYTAIPENGMVRVVEGSYTERAKSDYLTYEIPVENASAEIRGALDAAIGLQNALARGIYGDCGISDADKLNAALAALFTKNAAAELAKRCVVTEADSTKITDGGLLDINLSETILMVSEEVEGIVSGTLYINAGSFGGRTAYYSCPVKLMKTDSGYLVDGVIE